MSMSPWIGTVWSLRGAEGSVLGRVLAVDGRSLILTIVGVGRRAPEGVTFLSPNDSRRGGVARVSTASLLAHWDRMSGNMARLMDMPVHEAAR